MDPSPDVPPPPTTTTIPSTTPPSAPPSTSDTDAQPTPPPEVAFEDAVPQQEPTPPATPLPEPHRTPTPSPLRKLHRLILSRTLQTAHSTDNTLAHLTRLLSTPSGIDSFLCTLGYALTLLHPALTKLLTLRLRALATSIATKADGVLLPGETLITTFEAPLSTRILASSAAGSKALAGVISDYRIFVRLWGLLGIYSWGKAVYNSPLPSSASGKDKVLRAVAYSQVAACTLYQFLENGAYLASKGVLVTESWQGEGGARRQARWWVWSSRFWAAHVALEAVRLGTLWWAEEKAEKEGLEKKKADHAWWRDLVSNAAYAPLTVHWSTEEGVMGESWVGFLGTVAGGVGLLEKWRQTA